MGLGSRLIEGDFVGAIVLDVVNIHGFGSRYLCDGRL